MKNTIGYYLAFLALGMVAAVLGPTLPSLAEQTGTILGSIGILFTVRAFGYLSGSYLGGRAYDRYAGHPLIAGGLVAMALTLALVPFSPTLWVLVLVMLAMGIAEGLVDVGGNALLVWVHGSKVAPFMNGLHFFFGAGAFIAPLIVAQTLNAGGIRWAYWTLAILMVIPAFWLIRLPSPGAQDSDSGGENSKPAQPLLLGLIAIFLILYVGVEIGYSGWLFTYAVKTGLAEEAGAAYLTSVFWVSFTLGRLISIPLGARLRPRQVLGIDFLGGVVALLLLVFFRTFPAATWVGSALLGLSIASMFPTMISLAERNMAMTGKVTSVFFIAAGFGAMVLPWLIGQIITRVGPEYMVMVVLIFFLLAGSALWGVWQRIKQHHHSLASPPTV